MSNFEISRGKKARTTVLLFTMKVILDKNVYK